MAIASVNPATGKTIKTFEPLTEAEVEAKLAKGQAAFEEWRALSLDERAAHMQKAAAALRAKQEEYAQLLTMEMGKTIGQARAEVEKSAWNFEHYANESAGYLQSRTVETDASKSYVSYEPLGVILNIMPWNFAFWQALRMAAPILMAGNTIVLKHASNVPQSSLAIEEVLLEAGLPEGVYQTLLIGSGQVESVIDDERVKGVSLTGSEAAGRMVGSQAGKAIKPVVLELGGSDPSIVLSDADLALTCETVAQSRLLNNGQSCIGSKRFIVVEDIYDDFLEQLKDVFESYVLGNPADEATTIGPVVSEQALEELLEQVKASIDAGARVVTGGKREPGEGFYMQPTVLADVNPDVPSYHEEIFGPVASVIKAKDVEDAIRIANDSKFGLGASVYTKDTALAESLVPKIEAGSVFINGLVKSDPRLPFGGIKTSGVGRELSEEGIRAFTNVKTVWIA